MPFALMLYLTLAAAEPQASTATTAATTHIDQNDDGHDPVAVPEPSAKAVAYYESGNVLFVIDSLLGLLIPCVFLFSGASSRLARFAARIGRRWFFTVAIYGVLFGLLMFLIDLPLGYYEEFVRQHAYGLSNQTFEKWFGDALKGLMVSSIITALFLWVPYLLLKRSPRRWWIYTGALCVPFFALALLVTPLWIEPLFNDFGPMKDHQLETQILGLAERAGIEGSRVFEVNKSVDTNAVNAYVTGFGSTKRIVLWDTILAKLSAREVLVVMGHEMGHYVLHHVVKAILFLSALILVTLFLAHLTAGSVLRRFGGRFGFTDLSDVASLPLILVLVSVASLLVNPIALGFTRHIEHEADRFALELTRENRAAAMAFVKLQQENLAVPRPGLLYKIFRADHPPIGERIDFCNEYRPWEKGEPLIYGDAFTREP